MPDSGRPPAIPAAELWPRVGLIAGLVGALLLIVADAVNLAARQGLIFPTVHHMIAMGLCTLIAASLYALGFARIMREQRRLSAMVEASMVGGTDARVVAIGSRVADKIGQ